MHRGHEVEVVRPQGAGKPIFGIGRVPALVAMFIDRDPIGMRIVDVLVTSMRIGSRNHIHAKLPASRNDVAESVHGPEPSASIVERDFSWIESDNAPRTQAGRIGMDALEVVEPEREAVIAGLVFDECQLGPTHRAVIPSGRSAVDWAIAARSGR